MSTANCFSTTISLILGGSIGGRAFISRLLWLSAFFVAVYPLAAAPSRILKPSLGGVDPRPVILSTTNSQGQLQATVGGFQSGPFQAEYSTNLAGGGWTKIGQVFTNNIFDVNLPNLGGVCFFRIGGAYPSYASASVGGLACGQCHSLANGGSTPHDITYDYWIETPHAKAFANLVKDNPANATNKSCLPCHTVAYGYPGGYTPGNIALEGVQCESCHGPGGVRHRTGKDKLPAIETTSMVCGGCHSVAKHPAYDDWKLSGHAEINQDVASLFRDPTNGPANMVRCGSCHSGAVRAFLFTPWGDGSLDPAEAGREGIVCVGCHDPHAKTVYGHQLRNPLYSTNFYSVTPATNSVGFFQQYQPGVNLCAQCHNARGAAWTDTSRPPHHSPQYNLLLGNIGALPTTTQPNQPSSHGLLIANQCVGCHMPQKPYGGEGHPAVTGHAFEVSSYASCLPCHPFPELLAQFTVSAVSNQVVQVKLMLDNWALTRAPGELRANYGVRAWEYTNPGELSNPPGVTGVGPATAEQALIPANIKKARFDLYLVLHDGSYGVHNGPHSIALLDSARNLIQTEMVK